MNTEHWALRKALHTLVGTGSAAHHGASDYIGSPHQPFSVNTPNLRRLAKRWLTDRASLPPQAILAVADEMFAGSIHEEKTLAALILGYSTPARRAATPARIDIWLEQLAGWAEIDALCSNIFQAEELLGGWRTWEPWLRSLASDNNINKRRASLVLLTGPVRRSDDPRLLAASLSGLERLQLE